MNNFRIISGELDAGPSVARTRTLRLRGANLVKDISRFVFGLGASLTMGIPESEPLEAT
jgi:hypothetical protein